MENVSNSATGSDATMKESPIKTKVMTSPKVHCTYPDEGLAGRLREAANMKKQKKMENIVNRIELSTFRNEAMKPYECVCKIQRLALRQVYMRLLKACAYAKHRYGDKENYMLDILLRHTENARKKYMDFDGNYTSRCSLCQVKVKRQIDILFQIESQFADLKDISASMQ